MTTMLTADDRLAIKDILARWAMYEDRGDSEAWAALFTEDGRCTYSSGRTVVGRIALAQASRDRWARPASRRTNHWMGDAVISPTDYGAHVTHYCMILEKTDERFVIQTLSERSYELVRADEQWLIRARTYTALPREA